MTDAVKRDGRCDCQANIAKRINVLSLGKPWAMWRDANLTLSPIVLVSTAICWHSLTQSTHLRRVSPGPHTHTLQCRRPRHLLITSWRTLWQQRRGWLTFQIIGDVYHRSTLNNGLEDGECRCGRVNDMMAWRWFRRYTVFYAQSARTVLVKSPVTRGSLTERKETCWLT